MGLETTPSYFAVVVAAIGAIALFVLKREVDRILAAVDRIPSAKTFEEWGRKLEQHEHRISRMEHSRYDGPERRRFPRDET